MQPSGTRMNQLGNLEETVLLISMYIGEVYAVSVAEEYEHSAGQRISVPAIHTVLRRLEQKGFLRSKMGDASPQRGGRRKRLYEPTAFGFSAASQIRNQRMKVWAKIPQLKIKGT